MPSVISGFNPSSQSEADTQWESAHWNAGRDCGGERFKVFTRKQRKGLEKEWKKKWEREKKSIHKLCDLGRAALPLSCNSSVLKKWTKYQLTAGVRIKRVIHIVFHPYFPFLLITRKRNWLPCGSVTQSVSTGAGLPARYWGNSTPGEGKQ